MSVLDEMILVMTFYSDFFTTTKVFDYDLISSRLNSSTIFLARLVNRTHTQLTLIVYRICIYHICQVSHKSEYLQFFLHSEITSISIDSITPTTMLMYNDRVRSPCPLKCAACYAFINFRIFTQQQQFALSRYFFDSSISIPLINSIPFHSDNKQKKLQHSYHRAEMAVYDQFA